MDIPRPAKNPSYSRTSSSRKLISWTSPQVQNIMASQPPLNHLLKHRKTLALSQEELAFLLGALYGTKVCRYERQLREPSLQTILAYEAVFNQPASKLFPASFRRVERDVLARAEALSKSLPSGNSEALTARKRQSLAGIAARCRDSQPKLQ